MRNVLVLSIVIALGGAGSFPPLVATPIVTTTDGDPAIAALAAARAEEQAGNLSRAESETRAFIATRPGSAQAMYLLGRILEARKQATESLAWYTRAAAISSPSGEDLRLVAMDYVLLKAYPQALHWLTSSVQHDAQNAEAWYDLGRVRMMQGEYRAAEAPLLRALVLAPKLAKAENNLGVIYEQENELARAAAAYRLAIAWQQAEAHPSEQPLLNLGALLIKQGQTQEALLLLRRAVEIAPADVRGNEQLARALAQQGALSEAIEHLRRAVTQQPNSAPLHYQLGQLYRRAGEPEKAKQELKLSQQLYGSQSESEP